MQIKQALGLLILSMSSIVLVNSHQLIFPTSAPQVLSSETEISLENRVSLLEKRISTLEKRQLNSNRPSTIPKESYLLLAQGTTNSTDWTPVANTEFWLDANLYGNNSTVTWQGNIEAVSSDSIHGLARLYDLTNHRVVDYSEIPFRGNRSLSFYSQSLSIWRGQNQYRIEMKSLNGNELKITGSKLKISVK